MSASFKVVRFVAGEPSTAEILRRGWADALAADAEHADADRSTGRGPAGRCA